MLAKKEFILVFILSSIMCNVWGQDAYVNTKQGIFRMNGGTTSCDRMTVTNECGNESDILSLAVFKDTVYYNTWKGELKRFKPGVPGSCETLIESDFLYTAMTIDKNGIIYSGTELLVRYDPHTGQLTHLGRMPFFSDGDMIFYKDKLLLAGSDPADWSSGIFEINPDNLSASKLYMKAPSFIGLLSFPGNCGNSRWFGLSSKNSGNTRLIELDLDNKMVTGEACSIPMNIMDAAGNTLKDLVITGIVKTNPRNCGSTNGQIVINAESGQGPVMFTLLNSGFSQSMGKFTDLRAGRYQFRITNGAGCTTDTTIILGENMTAGGCYDIFIPNAFTPNGDGKNDVFNPYIPNGFKDLTFQVFNRWGNVVYQSKGGTIYWDGNFNGTGQPAAAFVYILNYTNPVGERKSIRGNLSLIR